MLLPDIRQATPDRGGIERGGGIVENAVPEKRRMNAGGGQPLPLRIQIPFVDMEWKFGKFA